MTDAQYYLNAELDRDADEEQLKVAYRRLAKYYHPDGLSLDSVSLLLLWCMMSSFSSLVLRLLFVKSILPFQF